MPKQLDLTNQTYGHWTVLRKETARRERRLVWLCRCVCGREKAFTSKYLRSGESKSCGKCGAVPRNQPKHFLTFAHKTASLTAWAEITGLPYRVLLDRWQKKWAVEEILFTQLRPGRVKFKPKSVEDSPQNDGNPDR